MTRGPRSGDHAANSAAPPSSIGGRDAGSDEELVASARAGDARSFASLFDRHQDRVYQMAFRILGHREDALDAAQEVFLAIHRGLAAFEGKSRFTTWLYRITVNRCRDELRRRASVRHTRPQPLRPGEADPVAPGPGPAARAADVELHGVLEQRLRELPDELREILVLREIESLAYEEIADALAIPVGTVRSRLHRARSLLAERLGAGGAKERG